MLFLGLNHFKTHLKSATNNASIKPASSTVLQNSEASSSTQQSPVSSTPPEQPASQQRQEASSRDAEPRPGPSEVRKNNPACELWCRIYALKLKVVCYGPLTLESVFVSYTMYFVSLNCVVYIIIVVGTLWQCWTGDIPKRESREVCVLNIMHRSPPIYTM